MRFAPESDYGANAGLKVARDLLEPVKAKFPWLSYADLYTLGGVVAVEEMGGAGRPAFGQGWPMFIRGVSSDVCKPGTAGGHCVALSRTRLAPTVRQASRARHAISAALTARPPDNMGSGRAGGTGAQRGRGAQAPRSPGRRAARTWTPATRAARTAACPTPAWTRSTSATSSTAWRAAPLPSRRSEAWASQLVGAGTCRDRAAVAQTCLPAAGRDCQLSSVGRAVLIERGRWAPASGLCAQARALHQGAVVAGSV